jgi:formylglycine-generating enzyme required for sulfatase activity
MISIRDVCDFVLCFFLPAVVPLAGNGMKPMNRVRCVFWLMVLLAVPAIHEAVAGISVSLPGAGEREVRVVSGVLNNQSFDARNPQVTVAPAERIEGSVVIRCNNPEPAASVAPVAATPTWGNPRTSFWVVDRWAKSGVSEYRVPITLTAPDTPGTRYIVFAMGWTYNAEQIMSGTHPGCRADWERGSHLVKLPATAFERAMKKGQATIKWYHPEGTKHGTIGMAAVRVVVAVNDEPPLPQSEPAGGYAVCISRETMALDDWAAVAHSLAKRRRGEIVLFPSGRVTEALPHLAEMAPRFAAFVARPEESGREFVTQVHRLTRSLDADPFADCLWGIVTGYVAKDAMRIATTPGPLAVRRLVAGTGTPDSFVEGVVFSECEAGVRRIKEPGSPVVTRRGPADATSEIVAALNRGDAHAVITSGHATERDWQIGFSFHSGRFCSRKGNLFGIDTEGQAHPVQSPNPKVYLASGNCLAGHVIDREAMALAWIHSAGVRQVIGYTVSTWFGYVGWGAKDYWVGSQGRLSLAEAFHAAVQADIFELALDYPGSVALEIEPRLLKDSGLFIASMQRRREVDGKRNLGLLWDRDTVAFYGDPAWEARLDSAIEPPLDVSTLDRRFPDGSREITLRVTANRAGTPKRPVFAMLERPVHAAEFPEGVEAVSPGHCVLWRIGRELERNETVQLKFIARDAAGASQVRGFTYLREETCSCGGKTNRVKIYRHNKTGLEFVLVPGGTFWMGSPEEEERGFDYERPQHKVTVKPFLMCRTEVPNHIYRMFRPNHDIEKFENHSLTGDEHPAVGVTWDDAVAFCQWAGNRLRLPTEAEWEYACRAGTTTLRFWGNDFDEAAKFANVADRSCPQSLKDFLTRNGGDIWLGNDGQAVTAPVASYWPNAVGLYDMLGNVWEWCEDIWHLGYDGAPSDGSAWDVGDGPYRVLRGGSWFYGPQRCSSAHRLRLDLGYRVGDVGFRPAKSLEEGENRFFPKTLGRADDQKSVTPVVRDSKAPVVEGFEYLREETVSCNDASNSVRIYLHKKTGFEFVLVPGRSFWIGSTEGEDGRFSHEGSGHQVTVRPFLICRTECTQAAWNKVGGPNLHRSCPRGESFPVVLVDWNACMRWSLENGLRLPTETEWEYACRAGTASSRYFGDSGAVLDDHAWTVDNAGGRLHGVGLKRLNPFGLFDMYGNAWEWCADRSDRVDDEGYIEELAVVRGGSFAWPVSYCTSGSRFAQDPKSAYSDLGFRPAADVPLPEKSGAR